MARFEGSWRSRKDFAAEAGVGLAIFQYWPYKVRRARQAMVVRKAPVAEVRLLSVTVRARTSVPVRLEIFVAGERLRVPVGADPGYGAHCRPRSARPACADAAAERPHLPRGRPGGHAAGQQLTMRESVHCACTTASRGLEVIRTCPRLGSRGGDAE